MPMPGVTLNSEQMSGSKELKISAMLSGGKGDVAWQHTQLFRTEMTKDVSSKPQFKFVVKLQCDKWYAIWAISCDNIW